MFVVNFDFSDHLLPLKLLAINVPVALTEALTYPLQRLQTLLVSQNSNVTGSQSREMRLLLSNMASMEGFPKLLNGMRYSVDYMGTQMTTKFVVFDLLMEYVLKGIEQQQKWKLFACCLVANLTGTVVSQIAFNYQTLASSLPVSKSNSAERVREKIVEFTKGKRLPIDGLKYTAPISVINTALELTILHLVTARLKTESSMSYLTVDLLSAFSMLTVTSFLYHYAFQRQVQIVQKLPSRSIPYGRGLLGSLVRYNTKGLVLFGLYAAYFEVKTKSELNSVLASKRDHKDNPMAYRY